MATGIGGVGVGRGAAVGGGVAVGWGRAIGRGVGWVVAVGTGVVVGRGAVVSGGVAVERGRGVAVSGGVAVGRSQKVNPDLEVPAGTAVGAGVPSRNAAATIANTSASLTVGRGVARGVAGVTKKSVPPSAKSHTAAPAPKHNAVSARAVARRFHRPRRGFSGGDGGKAGSGVGVGGSPGSSAPGFSGCDGG